MPKGRNYFEKIREKNRKLILKNALKLFAKNSYNKTTVEQIAKKCKFSKGLIYNYFESKEEILLDIINEGINKVLLNLKKFTELKTEDDLKEAINIILKTVIQNRDFFRLYFGMFNENVLSKKHIKQIKAQLDKIFYLFLSYYQNKGTANPEIYAYTIISALDGFIVDYVSFDYKIPILDMGELLFEKFK